MKKKANYLRTPWRHITLAPDGGEWSASRPITVLDGSGEEEIYCLCRDSNPGLSSRNTNDSPGSSVSEYWTECRRNWSWSLLDIIPLLGGLEKKQGKYVQASWCSGRDSSWVFSEYSSESLPLAPTRMVRGIMWCVTWTPGYYGRLCLSFQGRRNKASPKWKYSCNQTAHCHIPEAETLMSLS